MWLLNVKCRATRRRYQFVFAAFLSMLFQFHVTDYIPTLYRASVPVFPDIIVVMFFYLLRYRVFYIAYRKKSEVQTQMKKHALSYEILQLRKRYFFWLYRIRYVHTKLMLGTTTTSSCSLLNSFLFLFQRGLAALTKKQISVLTVIIMSSF